MPTRTCARVPETLPLRRPKHSAKMVGTMTKTGAKHLLHERDPSRRGRARPFRSRSVGRFVLSLLVLAFLLPTDARAGHVANVTFPSAGASAAIELRGTLYHPRGQGPFPALILLHGCDGVVDLYHKWAGRFAQMGYAALIVDSFKPRGLGGDCRDQRGDPPALRVDDALGARAFLAGLSFVDPARLALIGWEDGGDAALRAVSRARGGNTPGFRAAAAFYPGCDVAGPFDAPILVLMGDEDRWSPVAPCARMVRDARKDGVSPGIELQVYPGATHLFDDDFPTNSWLLAEQARGDPDVEVVSGGYLFLGHMIRYDRAAHDDAVNRLDAFLARAMDSVQAASGQ